MKRYWEVGTGCLILFAMTMLLFQVTKNPDIAKAVMWVGIAYVVGGMFCVAINLIFPIKKDKEV